MKAFPDDATGLAPPQSPTKRISTASSQRLYDIMNEPGSPATPQTPPIPPKSSLRERASTNALQPPQSATSSTWPLNSRPSESTQRTGPPKYNWFPGVGMGDDDDNISNGPVEGEKLAALRHSGGFQRKQRARGGWGRIWLMIGLVALLITGLAVGLGVGLTVGRRHKSKDSGNGATVAPAADDSTAAQSFPLGQYSIVTALKTVNTSCTSNPNTWTCDPSTVYDAQSPSTFNASMAEFQWMITNTSSTFASNGTATTPDAGVPANLTISTTDNPLSISFSNKSLTYINPASNSSAERYTFSFTMAKSVIPSIDISGTGTRSECYFNQTTFTGTLYLSEPRTYPNNSTTTSNAEWPYAIEITQSSPGGQSGGQIIPACYSYVNGVDESLIDAGLSAESTDSQCECGYRNF